VLFTIISFSLYTEYNISLLLNWNSSVFAFYN